MNKTAIIYATKTGHSQKLAQAIEEAVGAKAENVSEGALPPTAELLFIVGGIYAGKSLPELVAWVESIGAGSVGKAVLVTSSASVSKRSQLDIRRILTQKGIEVLEEITCPGNFLFIRLGHPNAADVKGVAERVRQIMDHYVTGGLL